MVDRGLKLHFLPIITVRCIDPYIYKSISSIPFTMYIITSNMEVIGTFVHFFIHSETPPESRSRPPRAILTIHYP